MAMTGSNKKIGIVFPEKDSSHLDALFREYQQQLQELKSRQYQEYNRRENKNLVLLIGFFTLSFILFLIAFVSVSVSGNTLLNTVFGALTICSVILTCVFSERDRTIKTERQNWSSQICDEASQLGFSLTSDDVYAIMEGNFKDLSGG